MSDGGEFSAALKLRVLSTALRRLGARALVLLAMAAPHVCHGQYESLFEPDVGSDFRLVASGSQLQRYVRSLHGTSEDHAQVIRDQFKDKFRLSIQVRDGERVRNVAGRARITGDWRDHIDGRNNRSSLNVYLSEDHIGHITQFRLLLPHTRPNEVFWTALLETLGFPAPYAKRVTVSFLGEPYAAIFEEIPAKELLERFGLREAPIVEADERQVWATAEHLHRPKQCARPLTDGRCDWTAGLPPAAYYKVDNAAYLKTETALRIGLRAIDTANHARGRLRENSRFFATANSRYARHGTYHINHKFIFEPLSGRLIPLYNDGNVLQGTDLCEDPDEQDEQASRWSQTPADGAALMTAFKARFERRFGSPLDDARLICVARDVILTYLETARWWSELPWHERIVSDRWHYRARPDLATGLGVEAPFAGWNVSRRRYEICPPDSDAGCEPIDLLAARSHLSGNAPPDVLRLQLGDVAADYERFPITIGSFDFSDSDAPTDSIRPLDLRGHRSYALTVPADTTFVASVDEELSELTIELKDPWSSRVVLSGQTGSAFHLRVDAPDDWPAPIADDQARFDERGLTGCVTFVDSAFDGGTLSVRNAACEDALNLIRVQGRIDRIDIRRAAYDALDVDFSDLQVGQLLVRDADNDCADFSAGRYRIEHVTARACGDKGLSVGERSELHLVAGEIADALIAIAAKDSSLIQVGRLRTESTPNCLAAYRKKQEFDGAIIAYESVTCDGDFVADRFSQVFEGTAGLSGAVMREGSP